MDHEHRKTDRLTPITPRTVADQVADQLRHLIECGDFKPGDRIPSERNLARQLGVGRPAVREALRELKAQGLLVTGRGAQGTTVAGLPSPQFAATLSSQLGQGAERITELMEVRSAVEIEAAGLAARRATLEDLRRLSDLVTESEESLTAETDISFHAAIAAATHNPLIEQVIKEPVELLHDHMAAVLAAYYAEPGGAASLQQQHDEIRQAIRSGSEQKARDAMRRHLDYVARGLAQMVGTGRVIRLIFINLDGTLLAEPRRISERARRTIATVREAGVDIVLVSSRPARAIHPFHQQLGLRSPVIACNGALLWNLQTGAGLDHIPLDPALAAEVVTVGREVGAAVSIESDDEYFADTLSTDLLERVNRRDTAAPGMGDIDEILGSEELIDKVYVDLRDLSKNDQTAALAVLRRSLGEYVAIHESAPGFIDVTSIDASKVAMAQRLARQMQIPAEQTMGIGDHESDATLLLWAGIGVAMGNADPVTKAAADVITSSNLRDGVAEALEQWVLGQKLGGSTVSVPRPSLVD
ncbi:MAG: Cof-type HAD-IIB family hydrolase [Thermoleophilia bacterium]